MQTWAEIEEMLQRHEDAYPRLTPKTRKPKKYTPAWHKRLNDAEDYQPPAPAGVLVSCGCPVMHRIPPTHWQAGRMKGGGKAISNLDRRCFICDQFRTVVPEPVLA